MPTAKATLIQEMFERSLASLDAINDFCQRLQYSEQRQMVISTIPSIAATVLPAVINRYRDEVSADFFQIKSANTEVGIAAVRFDSSCRIRH